MPKPSEDELYGEYRAWLRDSATRNLTAVHLATRLNSRWSAAWEADEAERERGRRALGALEIIERWKPCHASGCGRSGPDCDCGLDEALEALASLRSDEPQQPEAFPPNGTAVNSGSDSSVRWTSGVLAGAATGLASLEYANDSDVEQFNRGQRIRRAAFEDGAIDLAPQPGEPGAEYDEWWRGVKAAAAARYPLKRRVRKVMPDPFGAGEYTVAEMDGSPAVRWRRGDNGLGWFNVPPGVYLVAGRVRALAALLAAPFVFEDDVSVEDSLGDESTREGT
jgi:hypothetical protein